MFDLSSWLPMLQDTQNPAPIVEAQQQQQLLQQLQNMIAAGQMPDTTAKAMQLAASGQGPESLYEFFGGPSLMTTTPETASLPPATTPGARVQESMLRDPAQMDFSGMLYGNAAGYKPGPMLPKAEPSPWVKVSDADQQKLVEKKPGLTAEQLAALAGMQPKYQEPKFADIRSGPASQVKFDPLAVQQRPRPSLYDILRGMR